MTEEIRPKRIVLYIRDKGIGLVLPPELEKVELPQRLKDLQLAERIRFWFALLLELLEMYRRREPKRKILYRWLKLLAQILAPLVALKAKK